MMEHFKSASSLHLYASALKSFLAKSSRAHVAILHEQLLSLCAAAFFSCCFVCFGVNARTVENFNSGWEWCLDQKNAAWQSVDLPHDFQFTLPWSQKAGGNHGFKPAAEARYRKTFAWNPAWEGRRVLLDFGGILFYGDVSVNGKKVASCEYGYLGFETDITAHLKKDAPNVVEVWCSTGPGRGNTSRWYTGGGLYRDVKLVVIGEKRIARHGITVTTQHNRIADISVELEGFRGYKGTATLEAEVAGQKVSVPVEQGNNLLRFAVQLPSITVADAKPWSVESPNLYTAKVTVVENGIALDSLEVRFGFRTIEFSKDFGFKLNGKKVFLKGTSNHHDLGALGVAAYRDAIRRQFATLKAFGFNTIRCSHNPYSVDFYDLADEMGLLVVDEIVDKWGEYWSGRTRYMNMWPDIITEWIRRDRNHPSIIMWSLGNELQIREAWCGYRTDDWGVTTYRLMKVLAQRWDSTRPFTVAMHPTRANAIGKNDPRMDQPEFIRAPELARAADIASFNYRWRDYRAYLEKDPHMIVFQSEATTSEWLAPYFGMDHEKMVGCSYWGAIEYWGESNKWPKKGWIYSFFSHTLRPFPQAWLIRSGFKPDEPVTRIGIATKGELIDWNQQKTGQDIIRENWNCKPGDKKSIWVFSNSKSVELFLNGKSLGKKDQPDRANAFLYQNVVWQPGELKAIGDNGASSVIRTSGPVASLKVRKEAGALNAELEYFWVEAFDAVGLPVPDAKNLVKVSVSGPGKLLALDNGDPYTAELFDGLAKRMNEGYLLAIVRRTASGTISLSANLEP